MAIKKYNIIVVASAAAIAVTILFFRYESPHPKLFESRVYEVANGWGYDILVNRQLLIRQESIPALAGNKSFPGKEQAAAAALLVIKKIRSGQAPVITKADIQKICPVETIP